MTNFIYKILKHLVCILDFRISIIILLYYNAVQIVFDFSVSKFCDLFFLLLLFACDMTSKMLSKHYQIEISSAIVKRYEYINKLAVIVFIIVFIIWVITG